MLAALFGAAIVIMKRWPMLPIARLLHFALVDAPLDLAERLERKHLILLGLVLFGGQAIAFLGPELALVYAMDVSFYVEAATATTLAAAASRIRYGWKAFKATVDLRRVRVRPRRRARNSKKPAKSCQNTSCNDNDRPWFDFARAG